MASKLKYLTIKEKIRLIEVKEKQNLPVKELVKLFGVGKSKVYDILKHREEIRAQYNKDTSSSTLKKSLKIVNDQMKQLKSRKYQYVCAQQIPTSGPIAQNEARRRFKSFKTHNNKLECINDSHETPVCEEQGLTMVENDWLNELLNLTSYYESKDIFSCHDFFLLNRVSPAFSGSEANIQELDNTKEKITVLLCCNFAGEMAKPLVIGKEEESEIMKIIKQKSLAVVWKNDKEASINSDIMREWLESFNIKMGFENRKVLLFMDSDYCLPSISLSNINIVFYPPKETGVNRPLEQGIIDCFNVHYLHSLTDHVAKKKSNPSNTITIQDAVECIAMAACRVKPQDIHKSFVKAGFILNAEKEEFFEKRTCHENTQNVWEDNSEYVVAEKCNTANEHLNKDEENYSSNDFVKVKVEIDPDVYIQYSDEGDSLDKMNCDKGDLHYKAEYDQDNSICKVETNEDDLFVTPNEGKHHVNTYADALFCVEALEEFAKRVSDQELLKRTLQSRILLESKLEATRELIQ